MLESAGLVWAASSNCRGNGANGEVPDGEVLGTCAELCDHAHAACLRRLFFNC